jgi:hypothetical protein
MKSPLYLKPSMFLFYIAIAMNHLPPTPFFHLGTYTDIVLYIVPPEPIDFNACEMAYSLPNFVWAQ